MTVIDKLVVFLASLAVSGAALFYAWHFNPYLSLLLALAGTVLVTRSAGRPTSVFSFEFITPSILQATHAALCIVMVIIAWTHRTDAAIFSPFQILPWFYIPLYALATIVLVRVMLTVRARNYAALHLSLHLFVSLTLAAIVYKLGYGFDPFIHHATEQLLAETGTIAPKPLYYIGHYALAVALYALTRIPLTAVDTWMIPVLAAVLLPHYALRAFGRRDAAIGALALLTVPYGLLISPTPQALAIILLIVLAFYAIVPDRRASLLILLALATMTIHPLAGIPAVMFVALVLIGPRVSPRVYATLAILTACALPVAIAAAALVHIVPVHFSFTTMLSGTGSAHTLPLALVYAYDHLLPIVLIACAACGIYAVRRSGTLRDYLPHSVLWVAMSANGWLIGSFINIGNVAAAEQSSYGQRLMTIAWYFALPLVAHGIVELKDRIAHKPVVYGIFGTALLTGALTGTWYLSYPRYDDVDNSAFVNVTAADIAVVRDIAKRTNSPYIVLANQMISAAALREYGFGARTPLHPEQYIYPIPTGGMLYEYYNRMITQRADEKTMAEAMAYAGVSTGYFLLPRYWERYEIISAEAKQSATTCEESEHMLVCIYTR